MPTPSAAAAAVVPDWRECAAGVVGLRAALRERISDLLHAARRDGAAVARTLAALSPLSRIQSRRQQVDDTAAALQAEMAHLLHLRRGRSQACAEQLAVLSPLATLERGYAIVTNLWGDVVRDAAQVTAGELLHVDVHRGDFDVTVGSSQ
jgi:exodeoxyribonuclease VII large subunit